MKTIKTVTKSLIEAHLLELGGGNQIDNLEQISMFQKHYLVELSKEEFLSLVFLEIDPTRILIKKANSRQLSQIAIIANNQSQRILGSNWDLSEIILKTEEKWLADENYDLPALLIRPSRNDERNFGDWYLQDGSHRSLGYAMKLVNNSSVYRPIKAYLATNEDL